MDARLLELEPEFFDAAICRLALMLIPERDKALAGIQRALKPDTRFAAIVLSTAEKLPHIRSCWQLLAVTLDCRRRPSKTLACSR